MTTPVVFVHGVGLDAAMWGAVIAQFPDDRPCIAINMAGHGDSPHAAADELSGYVDALEHDIAACTDSPIQLVGFSMGAMVVAAYALKRPENVVKLVLMNAIHQRDQAARQAVLERLSVAKENGLAVIADAAILRWFSAEFTLNNPDVIQTVWDRMISNDIDSYLSAYRLFATADEELAPRLRDIECPVLAATANGDANSTPAMSYAIANSVSDGRAIIWDGLAHGAPLEDPDRVATTLKEFFDEG